MECYQDLYLYCKCFVTGISNSQPIPWEIRDTISETKGKIWHNIKVIKFEIFAKR